MGRLFKYFNGIILLLLSLNTFSQSSCDPNYIEKIETDSCTLVTMSPERFAVFYKSEKNLRIIKAKIPELQSQIDSVSTLTEAIEESLESEIDTLNSQKNLLLSDVNDCIDLSVDLEIENLELIDDNEKLKRGRKFWRGLSTATVILLTLLIIAK